jgi:uncharacterized protein YjbI with pentapeptide repeats
MSQEQKTQTTSACPHPEAVGKRWGDPISAERQAELQGYLDAWNAPGTDHGDQQGPFDLYHTTALTGADVYWLAEQTHKVDLNHYMPDLHLEVAQLRETHLEGARLNGVHLEGAILELAHLEGAHLSGAKLSKDTGLDRASFADRKHGAAKIGLIDWKDVDLSGVDWRRVKRLGDERLYEYDESEGVS